jgi:hypothetical protein
MTVKNPSGRVVREHAREIPSRSSPGCGELGIRGQEPEDKYHLGVISRAAAPWHSHQPRRREQTLVQILD